MSISESLFLGALQGLTEFLPVSSSGHLFLAETWFGLEPDLDFEIWLHGASLLAVLVFFWPKIQQIFCDMFRSQPNDDEQLGWKLVLATFLTVPFALFVEYYFIGNMTMKIVGGTLGITAVLIWTAERFRPAKTKDFTWLAVFFLGLIQGIAALPGISRAGITIAFLILFGIDRKKSAEVSFLLSIPTILAALIFSWSDLSLDWFNAETGFAFLAALIASWLSIKWMLQLVQKNWIYFAPYCAILGGFLWFFA